MSRVSNRDHPLRLRNEAVANDVRSLIQPMIDLKVEEKEFLAISALQFWSEGWFSFLWSIFTPEVDGLSADTRKLVERVHKGLTEELLQYMEARRRANIEQHFQDLVGLLTRQQVCPLPRTSRFQTFCYRLHTVYEIRRGQSLSKRSYNDEFFSKIC